MFTLVKDADRRTYCGPSAVGLLTGVPVSHVEAYLRRRRRGGYRDANDRRIPIRGTYRHEVIRALKHFGCKIVDRARQSGMTLREFVHDVEHMGAFLVNVTGHFMTCESGKVYDGGHPDGVPIGDYHKGQRRVVNAWKVIAPIMPKVIAGDPMVTRKPPKAPRDLIGERRSKIEADIKRWTRKEKLAKTKLQGLRKRLRYYERQQRPGDRTSLASALPSREPNL
jgi:hypothetical protein